MYSFVYATTVANGKGCVAKLSVLTIVPQIALAAQNGQLMITIWAFRVNSVPIFVYVYAQCNLITIILHCASKFIPKHMPCLP